MTELELIRALVLLTSTAMEIMTAVQKAQGAMQARHARGGDYTPEEIAACEETLRLSKERRDAAIAGMDLGGVRP